MTVPRCVVARFPCLSAKLDQGSGFFFIRSTSGSKTVSIDYFNKSISESLYSILELCQCQNNRFLTTHAIFWFMENEVATKDYFQQLGEIISEVRKESGITQQQLAQLIGIAQPTLAHYEAGERRVSLSTLAKIAKALNLFIEDFLPEGNKKRGPTPRIDRELAKVKLLPENQQQMVIDHIQSIIKNNQPKA